MVLPPSVMVFLRLLCSCPFVEKFSLEIETYYTPDGGQLENVFNLKVLINILRMMVVLIMMVDN